MASKARTWLQSAAALAWLLGPLTTGSPASGHGVDGDGPLACSYAPSTSPDPITYPACATVSETGALRLQPGQLRNMQFDANGLAAVLVGPLAFYVARDGRSAQVPQVDGHAADFHDGLVPSPRRVGAGYKVGYVDKTLRLVIPARYDGGLDFDQGRAEVCRGCAVSRDGDYGEMQGGVWGCIDTAGREVVPVTQPSPDNLDCAGAGG